MFHLEGDALREASYRYLHIETPPNFQFGGVLNGLKPLLLPVAREGDAPVPLTLRYQAIREGINP